MSSSLIALKGVCIQTSYQYLNTYITSFMCVYSSPNRKYRKSVLTALYRPLSAPNFNGEAEAGAMTTQSGHVFGHVCGHSGARQGALGDRWDRLTLSDRERPLPCALHSSHPGCLICTATSFTPVSPDKPNQPISL